MTDKVEHPSTLEQFLAMSPEEKKAFAFRCSQIGQEVANGRQLKPEPKTGTCTACGGTVTEEHQHGLRPGIDERSVPIGPGSRHYFQWRRVGCHCTSCGLVYRFVPPTKTGPT